MSVEIKKVPGGLEVDGIVLKNGKCGCTSFAACCYTWSRVKKKGQEITFTAKTSAPDTVDNYEWGYTVAKDGLTVLVSVQDARDKQTYSGFLPPHVGQWEDRGWEILAKNGEREDGVVWRCAMSKWLYKEAFEGKPFAELPDDWTCPKCCSTKTVFENIG